MDNQDQTKTIPSGQENHGVHICNRCRWPFPNPHPSARHRRAHKKICGTIEGYKNLDLQQHTHLAVSDDELPSDEEKQTPSPKIEKRKSIKEFGSGGIGEKSGRSEDEVFSDAVTEFSDSGFSPGVEERFVDERDSDKNVDKAVVGDLDSSPLLKIGAIAGSTELVNSPIENSKVDLEVLESPDTRLLQDTQVTDFNNTEKYEVDNVLEDVAEPAKDTAFESSDAEIKLQETDKKISDPLREDGVKQSLQVQSDGSHKVESVDVKATANTVQMKTNSDSDTKGEGEETVRVLSVPSDLPVVDHSDTLLEDFKDHGAVKSNIPVTLDLAEAVRPLEGGNKDTDTEINSSADVGTLVDDFKQEREAETIQGNSLDEGLHSHSSEIVSSLDTIFEHTKTELFDAIPTVTSVHKEVHFATKLIGDDSADGCEVEEFVPDRDENREGVDEKQPLEINKSTLESVEDSFVENKVDQDSSLLGENDIGDQKKLIHEHSDIASLERTEVVATDENCAGNTNEKFESEERSLESTEMGIGASNMENMTQNHPDSQKGPIEDPQEVIEEPEFDNDYKVVAESVDTVALGSELKHNGDVGVSETTSEKVIMKEPEQFPSDMESSNAVEESHSKDSDHNKLQNQNHCVDTSVHSSSQNSVEGNWGSVSVLSTQSDAQASIDAETLASIGKSKDNSRMVPDERHLDKSACVEDPSFMTLVESADQKAGLTEIEAVQNSQKAVLFPTLTNVNKESEGRKKNEEVIEKVTKWSTGKHNALKNLLGEANAESKLKSPNQKDEAAAKDNAGLATSEKSTLPSEAPASQDAEKEWSPAKYPIDSKKDRKKVKGKPAWAQFVCCSSVNAN